MAEYIKREPKCEECIHRDVCYLEEVSVDIDRVLKDFGCDDFKPAADVVEVRHGEWIKDDDDVCWWLECSVCGEIPPKNRYGYYWQSAYCPNCGAKMDGGVDNG